MSNEKLSNEAENPALNKGAVMNSFRKRTFIEVFCAKCGVKYSDDAEYEKVFQDKDEAIETITGDDYWTVKGNKAFSENCS